MLGRILLTLSAAMGALGPFIADFNETHVMNPRWTPHAKFHNGQTMSMGLCLSMATLYYTLRVTPNATAEKDSLIVATVFGSFYWVTALSAILYPGALAIDPEFGEGFPQLPIFLAALVLALLGGWLEVRKLAGKTSKSA